MLTGATLLTELLEDADDKLLSDELLDDELLAGSDDELLAGSDDGTLELTTDDATELVGGLLDEPPPPQPVNNSTIPQLEINATADLALI